MYRTLRQILFAPLHTYKSLSSMAGSSCAPNRVNTIVPRAPFKTQHPTEIHEVESRIPSGTHALTGPSGTGFLSSTSKVLVTTLFCRDLSERLNLLRDEGEKWIANLIRETRMGADAKIDLEKVR
jgi:hypothetical protein